MAKLYNLTPHTLTIINDDITKTLPSVGCVRLSTSGQKRLDVYSDAFGVEIYTEPRFEFAYGFPDELKEGVPKNVVVSKIVADWIVGVDWVHILKHSNIKRVFYPDTGPESAVRKDGAIIGVRRLCLAYDADN